MVCVSTGMFAQANVLVMGTVANSSLKPHIEITVDERFIDGKLKTHKSKILEDNSFAFALEVRVPQIAKITYARNTAEIYLEPYDTLYIEAQAKSFQYTLKFSGRSGKNNELWQQYKKLYPINENEFQYQQYRKGIFWYRNAPEMDEKMRMTGKEVFKDYLDSQKFKKKYTLSSFDQRYPGQLTPLFKEFLDADIDYYWGYHLLMYTNCFGGMHGIDREYYTHFYDLALENNAIGNFYYREYIKAYMNHLHLDRSQGDLREAWRRQYELGGDQLSEVSKAYFQADLISRALYSKYIDEIIPLYNDFLNNNPYYEFNDRVVLALQKVIKYHTGSPAPEFTLKNNAGEEIRLSDFRGKAVYVNFWASWCQPCMKKMKLMKSMQQELEEQGVIFVNVSFDKTEERWLDAVERNEFAGVHLFSGEGIESGLAKDYNVKALPQFYLIDKAGNFVENPKYNDLSLLKTKLETLNQL